MKLSAYSNLEAAYGFKLEDLHESAYGQIDNKYNTLIREKIYLTTDSAELHHLFISVKSVSFTIDTFDPQIPRELVVRLNGAIVWTFILSDQQYRAGKNPKDGLIASIEILPKDLKYVIGLIQRKVPGIDYNATDLQRTDHLDPSELKRRASTTETTALGASTSSRIETMMKDSASEGSNWIRRAFPKYEGAIESALLTDIILIDDVRTGVCKNVVLSADKEVEAFSTEYIPSRGSPYPIFVMGSEEAALLAPECANVLSKAILEASVIENAKEASAREVKPGAGEVDIPKLRISTQNLVRHEFLLARRQLSFSNQTFHLWLSKTILETTFNHRLGKNIGRLFGAHYDDKWGIVKWWLSGGWILKHVAGSVKIEVGSAAVEVDFRGRTRFDALGYVDLKCMQFEIGSMNAFHERFDFTLNSRLFMSWRDGKVVFIAGFKEVKLERWRSFIRFILDKYIHNWKYVVARMIVDIVLGRIIKSFVEDEITNAMGSISLNLLEVSELPIVGEHFTAKLTETRKFPIVVGYASAANDGVELIVGTDEG